MNRAPAIRIAVYYAPAPTDPLWRAACIWLGRDPETAATLPQPDLPNLPDLTREAATYGFHATLKPPMRLATDYEAVLQDARTLAARLTPFDLPPLEVAELSGFLALRETTHSSPLRHLADTVVEALDRHRLPPDDAELARRRAGGRLTDAHEAMLARWGYPHVRETWFFHMTLTRRLSPTERAVIVPAAQAHFADALTHPRQVDALTIFTQSGPHAPFLIAERLAFGNGGRLPEPSSNC